MQNQKGFFNLDQLAQRLGCSAKRLSALVSLLPRHHVIDGEPYWTVTFARKCEGFYKEWRKLPAAWREAWLGLERAEQERVRVLAGEGWEVEQVARLMDVSSEVAAGCLAVVAVSSRWSREVDPTAYRHPDWKSRYVNS